ncbi:MAG TPA: PilZ domain-containing protein [Terriglobales bacterium]|nr:PilZ domain-containing protein [Terriglobales bacterium]
MTFQSLLVSKDEQATAGLTPVLSSFGLGVQCCGYPDALCRLTDQKFDIVVVDYDDPHSAALVLQNAYQATSGSPALTVALLGDKSKVRNCFGAGANFILYKPVAEPQAMATLRAATALMKRERRRAFRVPVQVPMQIHVQNGGEMEGILLDLSEEGLDVLAAKPLCPSAIITVKFSLPGGDAVEIHGEVAWANPNGESGVRFTDLSDGLRSTLASWVNANAPELPPEDADPVAQCKLSDLSLGACYVETESPFPENSGVLLRLKVQEIEAQVEGRVRVMHPGFGMGIEFASRTEEQRDRVGSFIAALTGQPGLTPELMIAPRALAAGDGENYPGSSGECEDALLGLLQNHSDLGQEEFLRELRGQRSPEEVPS